MSRPRVASDRMSHEDFIEHMSLGLPELTPDLSARSERESREECEWLIQAWRETQTDRVQE